MIDHSLFYSLQDHLRTGMCDLDHPIVYRYRKHRHHGRWNKEPNGHYDTC
jgi:hypothetical protein